MSASSDNSLQSQTASGQGSAKLPSPSASPSPIQIDTSKPREVVVVDDKSNFDWKDVAVQINSGAWAVLIVFALIFMFFRKPLNTFISSAIEVLALLKSTQTSITQAVKRNTETLGVQAENDRRVADTLQKQEATQTKIIESLNKQDEIHDDLVKTLAKQGEMLLEISKNVQPPIYQDKQSAQAMHQLIEKLKEAESEGEEQEGDDRES